VIGLVGCGRIDFDPTNDSAVGHDDAAPDARACVFSAWATPEMRMELSSGQADFGGQLTGDGLAYYFQSGRNGLGELFVSHRATRTSAWSAPALISELTGNGEIIEVSPSSDELSLYFAGSFNNEPYCMWSASRATTAEPFGNLTRFDALCPGMEVGVGPDISADGLTLYYNTIDAGTLGTIIETHRGSLAEAFPPGTPIAGLPMDHLEGYPFVMPDRLSIYYEGVTDPAHHLAEAHRTDPNGVFATSFEIPNVDDDNNNEDVSLTDDGLEMYFASGRGTGTLHIFSTTRTCD
jgi:hypothetical protein